MDSASPRIAPDLPDGLPDRAAPPNGTGPPGYRGLPPELTGPPSGEFPIAPAMPPRPDFLSGPGAPSFGGDSSLDGGPELGLIPGSYGEPAGRPDERRSPGGPVEFGTDFPPIHGSAPVADPGADPFRGSAAIGRASHPVTPHPLAPPPPPGLNHPGMARPMPPAERSGPYDEPSPWEPEPPGGGREQLHPRSSRREPPGSGPGLSVVPPIPEYGQDPHPSHGLQEPNVGENDDRDERQRLSDLMDPRMLRVPETLAWDPRRANGMNGDNGR